MEQPGVAGDARDGEDLGEMRRQAECVYLSRRLIRLYQQLNHQGDTGRIDVTDFAEVQKDHLRRFVLQTRDSAPPSSEQSKER